MNRSDVIAYGLATDHDGAPTLCCLRCAVEDTASTHRLPMTVEDVCDVYEVGGQMDTPLPVCERCAADLPNAPAATPVVGYASSETAYGRTVGYGFAIKVF